MKLTGSKKIMGGLALAGAFALTGVVGVAQQPNQGQDGRERGGREWRHKGGKEGRERGFGGRFFERLNLTDAQKEQMQQIAARHRESTKALRQQMRQARQQGGGGDGIFNGGTFNESAVRANAQARANAHVEMEVMRARMMSEMYAVLTPEQKTQLATERQQREQKRQERRARRGANTDQNQ